MFSLIALLIQHPSTNIPGLKARLDAKMNNLAARRWRAAPALSLSTLFIVASKNLQKSRGFKIQRSYPSSFYYSLCRKQNGWKEKRIDDIYSIRTSERTFNFNPVTFVHPQNFRFQARLQNFRAGLIFQAPLLYKKTYINWFFPLVRIPGFGRKSTRRRRMWSLAVLTSSPWT